MTPAEIRQLEEIDRLKRAIQTSQNPYLIRDYKKAIDRKQRELKEYRKWISSSGYSNPA